MSMFDDPNGQSGAGTSSSPVVDPTQAQPQEAQRQAEAEARRARALSQLGGVAMNPDGTPAGTVDLSYRSQLPPTDMDPNNPVSTPTFTSPSTSIPVASDPTIMTPPPVMPNPVPTSMPMPASNPVPNPVPTPVNPPTMPVSTQTTPVTPEAALSPASAFETTPGAKSEAIPEAAPASVTVPLDESAHDPFGKLAREAANPIQIQPDTALSDEEMSDMFRRETLSPLQRSVMFGVIIVVIGIFVAGGIWVYRILDPFDGSLSGDTDITTNPNANTQLNEGVIVPLHELDTDEDGLLDINEVKYGTDPQNADTDGDGYTDGSEVDGGYDPLNPEG